MSIQFKNSGNYTRVFTYVELDYILLDLNAYNQYYQSSNDDTVFIRISQSQLLIVDLEYSFNRKLFDNYSFQYSIENPVNVKLINNNSASEQTINDALTSIGYPYDIPILSLDSIFMKIYQKNCK